GGDDGAPLLGRRWGGLNGAPAAGAWERTSGLTSPSGSPRSVLDEPALRRVEVGGPEAFGHGFLGSARCNFRRRTFTAPDYQFRFVVWTARSASSSGESPIGADKRSGTWRLTRAPGPLWGDNARPGSRSPGC